MKWQWAIGMVVVTVILNPVTVRGENSTTQIWDFEQAAKQYCDTATLDYVEGVWGLYGEKSLTVLIRKREPLNPLSDYEVLSVVSADVMIAPGQVIGTLHPSADPLQFKIKLFIDPESLKSKSKSYVVKMSADHSYLTLEKRNVSVKVNPLALIPTLRRLVRVDVADPSKRLPTGFKKIYPEAGSRLAPRYF